MSLLTELPVVSYAGYKDFAPTELEAGCANTPKRRYLAYSAGCEDTPGCRPARCGRINRQTTINAAMIADASGRLKFNPPSLTGLSKKSPRVAPNGLVSMKAAQNSSTRERLVHK